MDQQSAEVLTVIVGANRTRHGYVGQVMIGNDIVWEGDPEVGSAYEAQAIEDAKYRVIDRLGELLRQPTEAEAELADTSELKSK